MVYDLIRNDPECYRLFMYGIEGEQYVLVAMTNMRDRKATTTPRIRLIRVLGWT